MKEKCEKWIFPFPKILKPYRRIFRNLTTKAVLTWKFDLWHLRLNNETTMSWKDIRKIAEAHSLGMYIFYDAVNWKDGKLFRWMDKDKTEGKQNELLTCCKILRLKESLMNLLWIKRKIRDKLLWTLKSRFVEIYYFWIIYEKNVLIFLKFLVGIFAKDCLINYFNNARFFLHNDVSKHWKKSCLFHY